MGKSILRIFICVFLIYSSKSLTYAEIIPIYPPNGSVFWESPPQYPNWYLFFEWENTDTSTEYVYYFEKWYNVMHADRLVYCCSLESNHWQSVNGYYTVFWRVKYHPKDEYVYKRIPWATDFRYSSDIFVFSTNMEIPQDIYNEYVLKQEQEEEEDIPEVTEPEVVEEEEVTPEVIKDIEEVAIVVEKKLPKKPPLPKPSPVIPPQEEYIWNVQPSVLGTSSKIEESIVCKFKYFRKKNISEKVYCDLPNIQVSKTDIYPFSNKYSISVDGNLDEKFKIQVDEYICVFDILKPKTWFRCEERFVKSKIVDISPTMFFHIYKGWRNISIFSYQQKEDSFNIYGGYVKDGKDIRLEHISKIWNTEFNIYYEEKEVYPLSFEFPNSIVKPFSFPFNKNIGVTQWYGYTEYQSPHTGIDFGSYKETVLAIGDGEVVVKGWDSYFGECLSGGNYVKVKQGNGMYTVYFHLEEIYVNTGDLVKKGDSIGKSGNTGAWNCQKLGYHLHMENRMNTSSSSHVNPVKYISADWQGIPTLDSKRYPGRLSGENPHPSF